jgi:hypothetical protein
MKTYSETSAVYPIPLRELAGRVNSTVGRMANLAIT